MSVVIKRSVLALLATLPQMAQAMEQHGEIVWWQAAARGAPLELRWTHEAGGDTDDGMEWKVEPELMLRESVDRPAWWNNGQGTPVASLRRAYAGLRGADWQIRVGKQVFDWSQTDTVSPADLLNPRDWSDITRVRKLAAPAASLRYGGQTSVEVVWLPQQQPSYLPAGAWLPPAAAGLQAPQRANGSQTGVRLAGNWMQADWSAIVYRGHSTAPALALEPGPRLRTWFQPLRAAALTLARQAGDSQVARLEVARYQQAGGGFIQYVASIDKETGDWLHAGDTLYAIVQYAGSTQRAQAVDRLGWPDFRRVLEQSIMFKASYDPDSNQRSLVELSGVWNTQAHDSYWCASWQRRAGNALTVTIAGLAMRGQPHTFWGAYRGNNRVTLELSWKY